MKIRNPIYLPLALLLSAYVALANHNAWDPLKSLATHTWQHLNPATQHK
jgi:hypothetical protein